VRPRIRYATDADHIWTDDGETVSVFVNTTHAPVEPAGSKASGRVRAPLDGSVLSIGVTVGDAVEQGHLVLVLEAMKMEHRIQAEITGTVGAIHVSVGDQVKTRQLLADIESADAEGT